ncbi:hypothetical protein JCM8547_003567 [Rhodosporidiobolus lusitaniae]
MVAYTPLPLSPEQRQTLISQALEARNGSYSPYSHFRVGACLLSEGGEYVKGANVECASYGGAICAERTAIVKGVSEGKRKYVGLAVTSDVPAVISPCGICRQVLREFCPLNMPILLVPSSYKEGVTKVMTATEAEGKDTQDVLVETTMGELLPLSFGPEDLDKPREPSSSASVTGAKAVVQLKQCPASNPSSSSTSSASSSTATSSTTSSAISVATSGILTSSSASSTVEDSSSGSSTTTSIANSATSTSPSTTSDASSALATSSTASDLSSTSSSDASSNTSDSTFGSATPTSTGASSTTADSVTTTATAGATVEGKVTSDPDWNYVGRYTESVSARTLVNGLGSQDWTATNCISLVTAAGYRSAGIIYGGECWGANEITTGVEQDASACNWRCANNEEGDATTCGGEAGLDVYETTLRVSTTTTTSPAASTSAASLDKCNWDCNNARGVETCGSEAGLDVYQVRSTVVPTKRHRAKRFH